MCVDAFVECEVLNRYGLDVGTTVEGPAVIEERESTCVLGPGDRGINVPLCYTRAMACYAVKCLTVPGMPNNEGAVAPIRVSAPQDSILNAQPPYPTGGRHVTGHMVVPLVFRTLADAVPGQVQADCGMMNIVTFQGTNPGGQPMSTIYFSTGGFGEPASRPRAKVLADVEEGLVTPGVAHARGVRGRSPLGGIARSPKPRFPRPRAAPFQPITVGKSRKCP